MIIMFRAGLSHRKVFHCKSQQRDNFFLEINSCLKNLVEKEPEKKKQTK